MSSVAPFCAVDEMGRRYTTAVVAAPGDWWYGATILTYGAIKTLREQGLLPLREVDPKPPAGSLTTAPVDGAS